MRLSGLLFYNIPYYSKQMPSFKMVIRFVIFASLIDNFLYEFTVD